MDMVEEFKAIVEKLTKEQQEELNKIMLAMLEKQQSTK